MHLIMKFNLLVQGYFLQAVAHKVLFVNRTVYISITRSSSAFSCLAILWDKALKDMDNSLHGRRSYFYQQDIT